MIKCIEDFEVIRNIIRWRSISMRAGLAFLQFDWYGFASLRIFPYEDQLQVSFKTEKI